MRMRTGPSANAHSTFHYMAYLRTFYVNLTFASKLLLLCLFTLCLYGIIILSGLDSV